MNIRNKKAFILGVLSVGLFMNIGLSHAVNIPIPDVRSKISDIQFQPAPNSIPGLPTGVDPRGLVGEILANIFDAAGYIRNEFIAAFQPIMRSSDIIPRWDGTQYVTGSIADNGSTVSITNPTTLTDVTINGNMSVTGDSNMVGDVNIVGNTTLTDTVINGTSTMNGDATVNGDLTITGDANIGGQSLQDFIVNVNNTSSGSGSNLDNCYLCSDDGSNIRCAQVGVDWLVIPTGGEIIMKCAGNVAASTYLKRSWCLKSGRWGESCTATVSCDAGDKALRGRSVTRTDYGTTYSQSYIYGELDKQGWTTTTTTWGSMSKRGSTANGWQQKKIGVGVEIECRALGLTF